MKPVDIQPGLDFVEHDVRGVKRRWPMRRALACGNQWRGPVPGTRGAVLHRCCGHDDAGDCICACLARRSQRSEP